MLNEKLILPKILFGDIKAYQSLFEYYYPQVRCFALGIVKDTFVADEIAQNVFIKIWIKRESIDIAKNFNNFLYTITRNEITDYFRSRVITKPIEEAILTQDTAGEPAESAYDLSYIKSVVLKEIDKMPPQRRAVFMMSRTCGLTNAEIAEKLQISKRTVEHHLNLALHSLREELGEFICWIALFALTF